MEEDSMERFGENTQTILQKKFICRLKKKKICTIILIVSGQF